MSEKAIFLDRDDTLIEDPGYISDPDQVKLIEGVPEALKQLKSLGYKLIVVTNQSGVARGIVTEKKLEKIHDRLKQLLSEKNAFLDKIYYCPYHPEGVIQKYRKESNCRKPNPGMLLRAFAEMNIDLSQSWSIGNSIRDIEAGIQAGCKTILIDAPHRSKQKDLGKSQSTVSPDYKAVNIKEAVNIIKKHLRSPIDDKDQNKRTTAQKKEQTPQTIESIQKQKPVTEVQEQIIEETLEVDEQSLKDTEQHPEIIEKENHNEKENIKIENDNQNSSKDKTELLLNDIAGQLRKMQRDDMFSEFSIMRLLAGIVQILVLFCLLITVWFLMSPGTENRSSSIFISLGFAVVLQLMALTFFIMHGRK